jgi:hypothetical protein
VSTLRLIQKALISKQIALKRAKKRILPPTRQVGHEDKFVAPS